MNQDFINLIQSRLSDPTQGTEGIRLRNRSAINREFQAAPQAIANNLLSFGGRSGKFGNRIAGLEGARLQEFGRNRETIANLINQRELQNLNLGTSLLQLNRGGKTSRTGTESFQGTNVGPGSALAGGLSGGLETGTLLFALNNLLK